MQFDWTILEKVGLGGVAIALVFFGYKIIMFLLAQWKESTEALNRNTDSFAKLSDVFERSHEREMEFQEKVLKITEDTNEKVTQIHREVVNKR